MRQDLAANGIHEEGQVRSVEGIFDRSRRRQEMGRVRVGYELGDDGRFGNDVAVVVDCRDEASLTDVASTYD